jgi:hypothetical protein
MKTSILKFFTLPSAADLAQRELHEAQLCLLKAQSAQEYAQQMVAYHTARIERLTAFLSRQEKTS